MHLLQNAISKKKKQLLLVTKQQLLDLINTNTFTITCEANLFLDIYFSVRKNKNAPLLYKHFYIFLSTYPN